MQSFETNLMRLAVAQQFLMLAMEVSRDLFGKGYHSLSAIEKGVVDQTLHSAVAGNYQTLTAEFLSRPPAPPTPQFGFVPAVSDTKTPSTGSGS